MSKTDPASTQMLNASDELRKISEKNMNDSSTSMAVDFEDFVSFYVNSKGMSHLLWVIVLIMYFEANINAHFDSISKSCDICSFDYDYIIKGTVWYLQEPIISETDCTFWNHLKLKQWMMKQIIFWENQELILNQKLDLCIKIAKLQRTTGENIGYSILMLIMN